MSISQTNNAPKRRGYGFGIGCFVFLLVSPFLLYYGYCWGLWGRNSLFLQYLFQCNCPASSEEARYPKQVDVVVPACRYSGSLLSPSGRLLYVIEQNSKYLWDLQTNEKIPFTIGAGSNHFLTDDLLFLSLDYGHSDYAGGNYILDRLTGKQYPIQSFLRLQPQAYSYGEVNTRLLFRSLSQIEKVFLIDNAFPPVIALSSDFRAHPEHSFTFDYSALPRENASLLEQFLQQNHIEYHAVPGSFQEEALSPDGRFIAREDGIYLVENGEKIVEAYTVRGITGKYFSVQGWTSDSSGVIYYKFLDGCLLELPSYDGGTCSITVPQPLIKLKVPEEYLSSTRIP